MTSVETGLKIFEKPEFGSVRVVEKDGDPWFVARDVCAMLGFDDGHTNDAIKGLDEDEKATPLKIVGRNDFNGLRKDSLLVNEPGLYSLILRSNKPEAKVFKRWITHEVIPTIRKTGSYQTPPLTTAEQIQLIAKGCVELEQQVATLGAEVTELKTDMPLYGSCCSPQHC